MRLFKMPFTAKYDMYSLVGDDDVLILRVSDLDKIETLIRSMHRNNMSCFDDLPNRVKRDCDYFNNNTSGFYDPISDKEFSMWYRNGYLLREVKK